MGTFPVHLSRRLNLLLGVAVAMMAQSQQTSAAEPPSPSVHRLVIMDGGTRRVHYVASGNLSTSDRSALSDLERTENELAYLNELQELKLQYLKSERSLEPRRRYVQGLLYGRRITSGGYASTYANYVPFSGFGSAGSNGYNGFYSPFYYGGGFGGYGGYGYPGSALGSRSASSYSETQSLQFGMGDEGRVKNAIVGVIAQQSSPEYAAAAVRNYEAAVDRAAASPILSRDLGLQKKAAAASSSEPTFSKGNKVTIWVGNDKYVGTVKDDRPGWVVIQTDKADVTVRKSEITRSEVPPKP
ncbi:MAG TPA: hypothetical protein VMF69_20900 [Gemmataceae bacterium]|nr:hypothetical protein [Gemmataceae bacterium]